MDGEVLVIMVKWEEKKEEEDNGENLWELLLL